MNDRHITNFSIAGFTYYDGAEVFNKLSIGTHLKLEVEPDNRYDPSAVKVLLKDTMLGYVPKKENELLSKFLRLGYTEVFEAVVNRVSPQDHPEGQVGVVVRVREKEK